MLQTNEPKLRISEIFYTINGEVNSKGQGAPSVFIRLAGCHLCCPWCDAPESLEAKGHPLMYVHQVIQKVRKIGGTCRNVTITGGEPLLQKNVYELMLLLVGANYDVSVETSGSIPMPFGQYPFLVAVRWVVDYKLDYESQMKEGAFQNLTYEDWVKIPFATEQELARAIEILKNPGATALGKNCKARLAISPVMHDDGDRMVPAPIILHALAEANLHDVNINFQLHKLVGMR